MDSRPLFQPIKLLKGLAFGCMLLANSLPAQIESTKNNKIIQQQVGEDKSTLEILADKALALEKEGKNKEAAEKIKELSYLKFGRPREEIEEEIMAKYKSM